MDALDDALRASASTSWQGRTRVGSRFCPRRVTQVAIAELIARNDRLERLVSELSLEIEALAASQRGDTQRMSRLRRTAR